MEKELDSNFTVKKVRSQKYLKAMETQKAKVFAPVFFRLNSQYQIRQYFKSFALTFGAYTMALLLVLYPLYRSSSVSADLGAHTLTVINNVTNSHGGTATAADFSATVTGTNVSPASASTSESGTTFNLDDGSFSVFASGPSGYDSSYSGCFGTFNPGDDPKTCTITSQDQPAQLQVVTQVNNTHGGTKAASDFTFSVTGTNPSPAGGPGTAGTTISLSAGAYGVSEPQLYGYSRVLSSDCSGTLNPGDFKTCTITNNDGAVTPAPIVTGELTVINNVTNSYGGTSTPADFTATITGTATNPSLLSFPTSAAGKNVILYPGPYSVFASGPSGYDSSYSPDCYGTINIGDQKICTITSEDEPGLLKVVTNVQNTASGTVASADFTFTVTGIPATPASAPGDSAGVLVTVNPGSYSVSEPLLAGYGQILSADCAGIILGSQIKTCTITDSDNAAPIISSELSSNVTDSSITITWTTNHPATSRVVYDTVSVPVVGAAPNYGYATTTVEDPNLVLNHSVTINGLTQGITYYLRPVSHGSPEAVGTELAVATTVTVSGSSAGGSGGGGSGGGSSGGGGSSSGNGNSLSGGTGSQGTVTSSLTMPSGPPQGGSVLGDSTTQPSGSVLGASTLPKTGIPPQGLVVLSILALGLPLVRQRQMIKK